MVSVIVPVYNGEKWIERCVISICKQTYANIEIIIVDDGSTDKTNEICRRLADTDERISLITQVNGGVTAARKKGVDNSHGEYICFVDADDYVLPDYIENLRMQMRADVALCLGGWMGHFIENLTGDIYLQWMLLNPYSWGVTRGMYSRKVLVGILNCPRDITIGEDLIANIQVLRRIGSGKVVRVDGGNGYVCTENAESATHSRKFSVEYEEKFMAEVEKALGNDRHCLKDELWLFKVRCWRGLIFHNVKVPRNRPWVKAVLNEKADIKLALGDKIVLHVANHYLAYWSLKSLRFMRKLLKMRD